MTRLLLLVCTAALLPAIAQAQPAPAGGSVCYYKNEAFSVGAIVCTAPATAQVCLPPGGKETTTHWSPMATDTCKQAKP